MLSQSTQFTNARRFVSTLLVAGVGCVASAAILISMAAVLRATNDVTLLYLVAAVLLIPAPGLFASGLLCAGRGRLLAAEEHERAASNSPAARPRKLFSGIDPSVPSGEIEDASRYFATVSGWPQAGLTGLLALAAGAIALLGWPTHPLRGDPEPLLLCSAIAFAIAFPFLILERLYANTPAVSLPEAERLARLLRVPLLALVGGGIAVAVAAAGFGWSLSIEWIVGAVIIVVALELLGRAIAAMFLPRQGVETARAIADSTCAGWIRFAAPSLQRVSAAARTQLGIDLSRSWALLFMRRAALPVAAGIGLAGWLLTGVSTLAIDERGIYERMGVPVEVLEPGLHVRLPWPFGRVRRLENGVIHQVAIVGDQTQDEEAATEPEPEPTADAEGDPSSSADRLWDAPHPSELTYLIASADNGKQGFQAVNIDIRFTYRIGLSGEAAMKAAYQVDAPETLVRAAASRLLARYFAVRTLSAALRDDRETIAGDIRSGLQRQLDDASSGIEMLQVVIEAIHPPPGAAHAYHSVQAAEINARTAIAREEGSAIRAGTAALLPLAMIIGHVLEERSLLGSHEAIRALGRLTRGTARRILPDGTVEAVAADTLRVGDLVQVRPGDRLPADGIVRTGSSSLDTAPITGESVPIEVQPGASVFAGSIALDGMLEIEITHVGDETALGRIVSLLQSAELAKPPITRLLERYAGQYITLVLLIAAMLWLVTGNTAVMLTVLVASCPCALVLAAPATAVAAIAVAGRHGILIKGTAFLEELANVDSVIFDKTGTVTLGELRMAAVAPASGVSSDALLRLAGSIGSVSNHPVSRALATITEGEHRSVLTDVRETRGLGMIAHEGGTLVALGRPELFDHLNIAATDPPRHDGPIAGVARGSDFLGWILLADEPRAEARHAIADLQSLGLHRQLLLTGDRTEVATRIAATLGMNEVCAEALPEQKMERVTAEVAAGHRPLVVGDGINDSLALKAGAVGIAMGAHGTDVALASSDLVLMTNDLRRLGTCIRLSRRCRGAIHANVAVGLGWTVFILAVASTGVLGPGGPLIAAVLHNVGTLFVIGNAGRLLKFDEIRSATVPAGGMQEASAATPEAGGVPVPRDGYGTASSMNA